MTNRISDDNNYYCICCSNALLKWENVLLLRCLLLPDLLAIASATIMIVASGEIISRDGRFYLDVGFISGFRGVTPSLRSILYPILDNSTK